MAEVSAAKPAETVKLSMMASAVDAAATDPTKHVRSRAITNDAMLPGGRRHALFSGG